MRGPLFQVIQDVFLPHLNSIFPVGVLHQRLFSANPDFGSLKCMILERTSLAAFHTSSMFHHMPRHIGLRIFALSSTCFFWTLTQFEKARGSSIRWLGALGIRRTAIVARSHGVYLYRCEPENPLRLRLMTSTWPQPGSREEVNVTKSLTSHSDEPNASACRLCITSLGSSPLSSTIHQHPPTCCLKRCVRSSTRASEFHNTAKSSRQRHKSTDTH